MYIPYILLYIHQERIIYVYKACDEGWQELSLTQRYFIYLLYVIYKLNVLRIKVSVGIVIKHTSYIRFRRSYDG